MFLQKSHWRRLEELRDTLLPRLISGKLRLPEAQEHLQDALA
jgi:type I restriction enzyme S subunit